MLDSAPGAEEEEDAGALMTNGSPLETEGPERDSEADKAAAARPTVHDWRRRRRRQSRGGRACNSGSRVRKVIPHGWVDPAESVHRLHRYRCHGSAAAEAESETKPRPPSS